MPTLCPGWPSGGPHDGERPLRQTTRRAGASPRRLGDDAGTALVEFTFVAVLLLTIVFGIINFGLILSFKQDMTRAAAEGARASAVALPTTVYGANDPRRLAGVTATNEAVAGFNKTCAANGMVCAVQVHDCDYAVPAADLSDSPDSNGYGNNSSPDCVTVKLRYDYKNHPLLVPVPLIAAFLPKQIDATSVVRLNE
jgi:Flp pilus assembly protein TadG